MVKLELNLADAENAKVVENIEIFIEILIKHS